MFSDVILGGLRGSFFIYLDSNLRMRCLELQVFYFLKLSMEKRFLSFMSNVCISYVVMHLLRLRFERRLGYTTEEFSFIEEQLLHSKPGLLIQNDQYLSEGFL
ncbi:hypothetical protein QQ045_023262 [Rhodiola kirilowii]